MLLEKIQAASDIKMLTPYWLYNHKNGILHSMLILLRKAQFSVVWGFSFITRYIFKLHYSQVHISESEFSLALA